MLEETKIEPRDDDDLAVWKAMLSLFRLGDKSSTVD